MPDNKARPLNRPVLNRAPGSRKAAPQRISEPGNARPRILIETDAGSMTFELFATEAPVTVANFLRHVDEGRYRNAAFYRTVTDSNQTADETKISVIQGGLDEDAGLALPPIVHESTDVTKIRHLDGTLSMARLAPGTATSEFFVCIGDQPALDFGGSRNPDRLGFAAFGRLLTGAATVEAIHQRRNTGQRLDQPVSISHIVRLGS